MLIKSVLLGSYATNCYLVTDEATKDSAVIDCGEFTPQVADMLRENGVSELKYILLTHGHFDHVCGVKPLKDKFGGRVCIHSADAPCLYDEKQSLNYYVDYVPLVPMQADVLSEDGDVLFLGQTAITVWHTPGHTKGSVCYMTDDAVFSGDTLFRLSMGRTDMPGGSTKQLFASLKRLGTIEGEKKVFPGHGEETSILFEKQNNRYLRAK